MGQKTTSARAHNGRNERRSLYEPGAAKTHLQGLRYPGGGHWPPKGPGRLSRGQKMKLHLYNFPKKREYGAFAFALVPDDMWCQLRHRNKLISINVYTFSMGVPPPPQATLLLPTLLLVWYWLTSFNLWGLCSLILKERRVSRPPAGHPSFPIAKALRRCFCDATQVRVGMRSIFWRLKILHRTLRIRKSCSRN